MGIKHVCIALIASVAASGAWAGGGGAPAKAQAKADYDVTGTWTAKIEGGRGPAQTLVLVLKQEGEEVTGTLSTNGGAPVAISDGKAGRSAVRFSVATTMPAMQMPGQPANSNAKPMEMVTKYTGKITGNDMEITRQVQAPGGMGGGAMPMGGGGMGGGMGRGGGMGGGMGGGGMGGGGMGGGGMPMGGGGGMPMGGAPMGGGPGGGAPIIAHRQ